MELERRQSYFFLPVCKTVCYGLFRWKTGIAMRVITGLQKGRRLQTQTRPHLRPTSGRVKEALFSILGSQVEQAHMVDLYAGTGAIGLEALSRGASRVVFVEHRPSSLQLLQENIRRCGNPAGATIISRNAWQSFQHPELLRWTPFDLVFADPPYQMIELEGLLLSMIEHLTFSPQGLVIVEHHKKTSIPSKIDSLSQVRQSRYGDTVLTFFKASQKSFSHANRCVSRDV